MTSRSDLSRSEALRYFRQGYAAGVLAERGRIRQAEMRQRRLAIERDLHEVIGILAVAMLGEAHRKGS